MRSYTENRLPAICECPEPVYVPNISGYECGYCGRPIDSQEHNRRILENKRSKSLSVPRKFALILLLIASPAFALTSQERKLVQHAKTELDAAIAHGEALAKENEQSKIAAADANEFAVLAAKSALDATGKIAEAEAKAKAEHEELVKCATENAEMRSIVDAVSGPWWFPGGRAVLYGLKKSAISLLVIVVGLLVIFVALTLLVPGLRPVLGFVGAVLGRIGKGLLALLTRKGKAAAQAIEHKTIGTDPPPKNDPSDPR